MFTKQLFIISSLFLFSLGILLLFLPLEVLDYFNVTKSHFLESLVQILSSFFLGLGYLNLMKRHAIIGGIYNRPIIIINYGHFFISTIILLSYQSKQGFANPLLAVITIVYIVFTLSFTYVLLHNPNSLGEAN